MKPTDKNRLAGKKTGARRLPPENPHAQVALPTPTTAAHLSCVGLKTSKSVSRKLLFRFYGAE
jgi:hypothetical protein